MASIQVTMVAAGTFVDAQRMHAKHPDTFHVPSDEELKAIKPGSIVKVARGGERFWAVVTDVEPAKKATNIVIHAKVDNHLLDGSAPGTRVTFKGKNVYQIYEDL